MLCFLNISTWCSRQLLLYGCALGRQPAYIKLPSLNMFSRLSACDHHHQLRNLSTHHPLVQLGHDLLDVGFDLIVGGNWYRLATVWAAEGIERTKHIEAIFLNTRRQLEEHSNKQWGKGNVRSKVLRRVDTSLETADYETRPHGKQHTNLQNGIDRVFKLFPSVSQFPSIIQ